MAKKSEFWRQVNRALPSTTIKLFVALVVAVGAILGTYFFIAYLRQLHASYEILNSAGFGGRIDLLFLSFLMGFIGTWTRVFYADFSRETSPDPVAQERREAAAVAQCILGGVAGLVGYCLIASKLIFYFVYSTSVIEKLTTAISTAGANSDEYSHFGVLVISFFLGFFSFEFAARLHNRIFNSDSTPENEPS